MQVWDYLLAKLSKEKIHLTLIDPNKQTADQAAEMVHQATLAGTDGIMVGGSTGISREAFDSTIQAIKAKTNLPVIIFPTNANSLSHHADAVFFMSLLNSKSIRFLTREQKFGAMFIKQNQMETIPMGYIIISPGMAVGKVGDAELIPREDLDDSISYALIAQYFGMKLVYLEAGSGAPETVTTDMVSAVKENIEIPLIIGGGIRSPKAALEIAKAGADIIVTGTVVEDAINIKSTLEKIIGSIKTITQENP